MPRERKGPRLWLRPEERNGIGRVTRQAAWFILDYPNKQIGTGALADDYIAAQNALLKYIEEKEIVEEKYPDLFLYFVTADVDGFPVKIGMSERPDLRLGSLQSGLPYELKPLAIVQIPETRFERRVHRKFAHIRLRGEWFKRTPELLDYIESLASKSKVPMNGQSGHGTNSDFSVPERTASH